MSVVFLFVTVMFLLVQISMLNKYSEAIRGNLNRNQRSKVVALVTIEVHARDVIDKLIRTNTNDVTAFEWLMQLRLYWDKVSCCSWSFLGLSGQCFLKENLHWVFGIHMLHIF